MSFTTRPVRKMTKGENWQDWQLKRVCLTARGGVREGVADTDGFGERPAADAGSERRRR